MKTFSIAAAIAAVAATASAAPVAATSPTLPPTPFLFWLKTSDGSFITSQTGTNQLQLASTSMQAFYLEGGKLFVNGGTKVQIPNVPVGNLVFTTDNWNQLSCSTTGSYPTIQLVCEAAGGNTLFGAASTSVVFGNQAGLGQVGARQILVEIQPVGAYGIKDDKIPN